MEVTTPVAYCTVSETVCVHVLVEDVYARCVRVYVCMSYLLNLIIEVIIMAGCCKFHRYFV